STRPTLSASSTIQTRHFTRPPSYIVIDEEFAHSWRDQHHRSRTKQAAANTNERSRGDEIQLALRAVNDSHLGEQVQAGQVASRASAFVRRIVIEGTVLRWGIYVGS